MLTLILMLGCAEQKDSTVEDQELILTASISLSEQINTVGIVEWETNIPTIGWVEFADGQRTPIETESTTTHRALLLGLKPYQNYPVIIHNEYDGTDDVSETLTITTGGIPAELPSTHVYTNSSLDGSYIITTLLTDEASLMGTRAIGIFDDDGDYVWYWVLPEDSNLPTAAAMSVDAQHLLFMEGSNLHRVTFDGTEEIINLTAGHHDFLEHEDGSIVFIATEKIDLDSGISIEMDKLMERTPSGEERLIWSAYENKDMLGIDVDNLEYTNQGLTHANAVTYDTDNDAYLVSLAAFPRIVQIDRSSGEINWILDGQGQIGLDFTPTFEWLMTHKVAPVEGNKILAFVNNTTENTCSIIIEVAIDDALASAEEQWVYSGDGCISVFGLGAAYRHRDDRTLAVWSTAGHMQEINAEGELIFEMVVDFGQGFGYSQRVDSLYEAP